MVGPYNTRSNDQTASSYAALPGTDTTRHVPHNQTPMKACLAPGREMPGCHPSRWIYELTNNKFTTCDLFERARRADLGSDYIWEHQHRLVFNGNQSFDQASDQVLSAICIECYFHFVFKMSWEEHHSKDMCDMMHLDWPVQDDMFPWHHLVWAGSDTESNITKDQTKYYPLLARENFVCSAPPCTFQLTLEISKPRVEPGWIKLLLDREAIRKQLDSARVLEPSRYENVNDEWAREAPLNLNTYLKNLLEAGPDGSRAISKRNKRFAVCFGPPSFPMFRALEFKEEVLENDGIDEGKFTPPAPAISDGPSGTTKIDTLRAYLEDVRSEVQCLIHKAGQAGERASYCAPMLHESLRCKELLGIADNALVDSEPYKVLGILPGQSREIVASAYKRQWALIPNQRRKLVDSLLSVANDSNDEALSDYAMMQSSVFDSQSQLQATVDDDGVATQALTFLGLEPPNNYTSEALIQGFRKKVARDPSEATSARSMLMVIAQASTDDSFQTDLLLESDRRMTRDTAKEILGLVGSLGPSEDTLKVAKTKLTASKSKEESATYLDALDAIAKHTESKELAEKCEELRRLNGIPGPDDDSDPASYLPVDFSLPVGLNNIGNTCYLNSLLQYLFTVKPIRDIVLNYDDVKLELTDESIQQRRLGGNRMQMDRGEAVVAQAFASELATLFRNLESSDQSATRPSQRLANAVLLSTHTLLETSTQQPASERPPVPQAPPLPGRPSPAPPTQAATDVSMADAFDDPQETAQDTQSQASDQTLVDREGSLSVGRADKIEMIPLEGPVESDVSVAEIKVDEDADMSEAQQGEMPKDKTSQIEPPTGVASLDDKAITDVTMANTEEPTVDQKVLTALEHQKRSSGTDQQDVEEVMGSIINRLQAAIRPSSIDEKTGVQLEKIMETFFVTTINYTKFKDRPYQTEISFDRSITAFPAENGACSLYDALGRNFDHQILEGSGEGNDLSRYTAIKTLPPVLHVLIQRTQSSGTKNGNHVVIPETLYLDRYMDAPHDSAVFRQRREEWVTSSRIKDLKHQLHETSSSSVDFSRFASSVDKDEQGPGETPDANLRPSTQETWDFDGPVDEDYVMVKPVNNPSLFSDLPAPPEDMESLGEQIRTSMKEQLAELEGSLDEHLASLKEIPYHLHAVICHRGALSSGHYWVWIHDFEDKVWRWYNDAQVKENKNTAEVLRTLSTSGEPYYLCYVRDGDEDAYVNVPKRERPEVAEEPVLAQEPATEAEGEGDAEGDELVDDDLPSISESKGNEKAAADTETLLDL